jgi:hypothetical protein
MKSHSTRRPPTRRREGDRGFVVAEWMVGMFVIMLPAFILLAQLPQWARDETTARSAAAEGARGALLANDPTTAQQRAEVRAREVAANYGHEPANVRVEFSGTFAPGESITVTVTITLAAIRVPFGPSVGERTLSAESTERVPDYKVIEGVP